MKLNNSLWRAQPQRDFMYDVAELRRSARGRWASCNHGVTMLLGIPLG
jgi:hypothetical protein